MEYITLGKTGLMVSRTAFGCLPIQRITDIHEAVSLLRGAYEGGINFFDTARSYTDSEEKLGLALDEHRKDVIIATKSAARNGVDLKRDLETSLQTLQTDYIDLFQLHNPSFIPVPGGEDGLYDALLEAKKEGMIRFLGITNHSRALALKAVESSLYDTLQYPFSYLSGDEDVALVRLCASKNIGFIAMKALSGGLIKNVRAAFAWIRQYEEAVPIWGIQKETELKQFFSMEKHSARLTEKILGEIELDRKKLGGNFCRGCGYCLPCPVNIPINNANRMSQLLRNSPTAQWLTPEWQGLMSRVEDCTKCGICAKRCPYGLAPHETLPSNLADYRTFLKDPEKKN